MVDRLDGCRTGGDNLNDIDGKREWFHHRGSKCGVGENPGVEAQVLKVDGQG